jgi:hypothetical protein
MQPVDSPHVSPKCYHPIEIIGPRKRKRLGALSLAERVELNRQLIKDDVESGLIRPSHNEFGSPIILCVKPMARFDYAFIFRGLNEATSKDAYPFPRVDDTLDELKEANFYTHLDLASSFWLFRVRKEDVHKTTFMTHDDLMEWVAMPLGMCNAQSMFQRMMNNILRDILYKFVTVYLDDVFYLQSHPSGAP